MINQIRSFLLERSIRFHTGGIACRDGGAILPQNSAQVLQWFRKSADQGFAKAENELGHMYRHGKGVPRD